MYVRTTWVRAVAARSSSGSRVEPLESRRLLSGGSVALDAAGTLRVTGTAGDDVIRITLESPDVTKLDVVLNGVRQAFPLASIHGIHVDAGNGNNDVEVLELNGPMTLPVTLIGGSGNDTLVGGSGNDLIEGGGGSNVLAGEAGNDTLIGGPGNDRLEGGPGNDLLNGNGGVDTINGGGGNDTIVPNTPPSGSGTGSGGTGIGGSSSGSTATGTGGTGAKAGHTVESSEAHAVPQKPHAAKHHVKAHPAKAHPAHARGHKTHQNGHAAKDEKGAGTQKDD